MATIRQSGGEVYYQMKKFLGLNEIEDGTTRLKFGEATESYNWRITSSQALQVREGTKTIKRFSGNANGLWNGNVNGTEYMIVCVGTHIYAINFSTDPVGTIDLTPSGGTEDTQTFFFAYSNKVYAMNGTAYRSWDGDVTHDFTDVVGYVPIVVTAATPSGGGTELQGSNLLSTHRKIIYNPDGTATTYQLPETHTPTGVSDNMHCVQIKYFGKEVWPNNEDTGHTYTVTDSNNTTLSVLSAINDGKIIIKRDNAALVSGQKTLMVEYSYPEDVSSQIKNMKFAENYNGNNGNRVFVYGDGTNKCFYSGLDYYGNATAEYFPAMNEMSVGEANTPITSMIRHFGRLIVFKDNSTYSVNYTTITLETGSVTAGFVIQNVNKTIGNLPYGQAVLTMNNPISIHDGTVYTWRSNSSTNGNLTYDERQAHRISERIERTLRTFNLNNVTCFDNNYNQEMFILYNDATMHEALIYNYDKDVWFRYTDFPAKYMVSRDNEVYCLCVDGTLRHLSRQYTNDDDGTLIHDTVKYELSNITDCNVHVDDELFYTIFGTSTTVVTCVYTSNGIWTATPTGGSAIQVTLSQIGVTLSSKTPGGTVTPVAGSTIVLTANVEPNPQPIRAFWRSGSLAFDKDWMRKYSSTIWVSVLPEYNSSAIVTARSDVKNDYAKKKIGYSLITFMRMNFDHFSFNSSTQPKMAKVKMKVKKFTYYQLCFEHNIDDEIEAIRTDTTSTILGVDFQIRYAGNVK